MALVALPGATHDCDDSLPKATPALEVATRTQLLFRTLTALHPHGNSPRCRHQRHLDILQ